MTRAPVTLSREMKILLTALGLVALLGGWLVWSNQQQAQQPETIVTPPPLTAPKDGTTVKEPSAGTDGTQVGGNPTTTPTPNPVPAAPGTGTAVTSDGKTEVATVPPFPVTDPMGVTPDPTVLTPVPSGINPNQPLNSLNGRNPFQPINSVGAVTASGSTPAATAPATPDTQTAGPVTIQQPTSTQAQIDAALSNPSTQGGALPMPQIPTTTVVTPPASVPTPTATTKPATSKPTVTKPTVTKPTVIAVNPGGALPIPQIPGAAAAGNKPTASGQAPTTTVQVPATGQTGSPTAVAPAPTPTPIAPPVTGVQEPSINIPAGQAGTGAGAGSAGSTAGTTGNNPQVIAHIQPEPTAEPTPTPVTPPPAPVVENKAETAINNHQLVFDAAVLGPVNTAVFRSDNGYVVVGVGQPIPNTNLILKEVTATTVTLTAGNDSKTLQLDKR